MHAFPNLSLCKFNFVSYYISMDCPNHNIQDVYSPFAHNKLLYMYIASTMNPMNDNESDSLYDDGCDIHKLTNACDYIQLLHFLNNY